MKAIEQYFQVVLFITLYKVVLTFKSVDETLVCSTIHHYRNETKTDHESSVTSQWLVRVLLVTKQKTKSYIVPSNNLTSNSR